MSIGLGYHYSHAERALVITSVDPRGPAYDASIQPGDKILSVDGLETQSGDVLSLLKKQPGEQIVFVIQPKPRPSQIESALGQPLMGGMLHAQPRRTVTLTLRDLPEPTIIDHIQAFFAPQPTPPPSQTSDSRCGVGIGIQQSGNSTVISDLASGGPADRSGGVVRGDHIIAIDGLEIAGLQIDVIRGLLLGPQGSYVSLTLKHSGTAEPVVVTLERSFVVPATRPPVEDDPFFWDTGRVAEPSQPRLKPGWLGKEFKLW